MPTLVLRETAPPAAKASGMSARPATTPDKSLEGVLLFSGIGFALMLCAIIFQLLELPPPYF
jgi:hypothetical protein